VANDTRTAVIITSGHVAHAGRAGDRRVDVLADLVGWEAVEVQLVGASAASAAGLGLRRRRL
jgi:hypothetical protein